MSTTDRNADSSHREGAPRLRSDELFRDHRRLIIEHAGEHYCLRLTCNERLIVIKG